MLIAVPVFFPLVVLRLLSLILPEEVTLVLDRVWVLTFVLDVPLVVRVSGGGGSSNGGGVVPG